MSDIAINYSLIISATLQKLFNYIFFLVWNNNFARNRGNVTKSKLAHTVISLANFILYFRFFTQTKIFLKMYFPVHFLSHALVTKYQEFNALLQI